MARILTFNHKIINPGNNRYFGSFGSGPTPPTPPEPTVYDVILTTDGHGSISANPMSGAKDTLITLSNTPDQNYVFSKYTLNNVDLVGNTFLMPEADANVKGWFEADMRTITVTQPSHGTITAPASAQVGSTVTLSISTDTGYALQYFTVNGSQIQGNSFVMPASNVTVSASVVATFDEVTIGSQTWMAKNLSIDDGQGGIYTQTVNYGQGNVVEHYYTLDAAVRVAASIDGWHLPTVDEVNTLTNSAGGSEVVGTKLKSTYGWNYNGNGTDNYGFSGFPAGYGRGGGYFNLFGSNAYFWSSTVDSSNKVYYFYLYASGGLMQISSADKDDRSGYSVRLVKD